MLEQKVRSSGKPRSRGQAGTALRATLERSLHSYVIAAGAAGVGLLSAASAADAKVVYTAVQIELLPNEYYHLDLNNDGRSDFLLDNVLFTRLYTWQSVHPGWSTGITVNGVAARHSFPLALQRGAKIGPGQPFSTCHCSSFGLIMAGVKPGQTGYWGNVQDRYLGLELFLQGKPHFGWARMTVQVEGTHIRAYLSGYAYETTASQPILAGQTSGTVDDPMFAQGATEARAITPHWEQLAPQRPQEASLGLLALGAPAVPLWRATVDPSR